MTAAMIHDSSSYAACSAAGAPNGFCRAVVDGPHSRVTELEHSHPLRLTATSHTPTSSPAASACAWLTASTLGGGITPRSRLRTEIEVVGSSSAVVAGLGFTNVFRSTLLGERQDDDYRKFEPESVNRQHASFGTSEHNGELSPHRIPEGANDGGNVGVDTNFSSSPWGVDVQNRSASPSSSLNVSDERLAVLNAELIAEEMVATSDVRVSATVGEGSLLVLAPAPLVAFKDSAIRQTTTLTLKTATSKERDRQQDDDHKEKPLDRNDDEDVRMLPSAVVFDWLVGGRVSRGELWSYLVNDSSLSVYFEKAPNTQTPRLVYRDNRKSRNRAQLLDFHARQGTPSQQTGSSTTTIAQLQKHQQVKQCDEAPLRASASWSSDEASTAVGGSSPPPLTIDLRSPPPTSEHGSPLLAVSSPVRHSLVDGDLSLMMAPVVVVVKVLLLGPRVASIIQSITAKLSDRQADDNEAPFGSTNPLQAHMHSSRRRHTGAALGDHSSSDRFLLVDPLVNLSPFSVDLPGDKRKLHGAVVRVASAELSAAQGIIASVFEALWNVTGGSPYES